MENLLETLFALPFWTWWVPVIQPCARWMQGFLPFAGMVVFWSALTALLVMGLYRAVSPQKWLQENALSMRGLPQIMLSLQATPEEASAATLKYLRLSLQRMGMSVFPLLLASLPAIWIGAGLDAYFLADAQNPEVLGFGPEWMRHWLFTYFMAALVFSLWLKMLWRLK